MVESQRAIFVTRELVKVAQAVLDGELHPIEGVRKIRVLSSEVGQPDRDIFLPIHAIESETDHYPVGDERSHWQASALAKYDNELSDYLMLAKDDIFRSCKEIVDMFSKDMER